MDMIVTGILLAVGAMVALVVVRFVAVFGYVSIVALLQARKEQRAYKERLKRTLKE